MMTLLHTLYYAGILGILVTSFHRLWFARRSKVIPDNVILPSSKAQPMVTLQIPVFNEKDVVSRILESISNIQYPQDKLQIQILDDSFDETSSIIELVLLSLQKKGWDVVHIRRNHRKDFKAGALGNGLSTARGEYVAIFDVDFDIPPNFFNDTLPYFQDERVGCVQIRWDFFNEEKNLLTRLQANLLHAHFQVEQKVRYNQDFFLAFNGTAGIWRKKAIVTSGGWGHRSLTEDLDLSYRAQLNGWKILYSNRLTARSQLPTYFLDFQRQQSRWAKGSIQSFKNLLLPISRANLPWRKKLEAFLHLGRHFSYFFTFFILISMPWVVSLRCKGDPMNYIDAALFFLSTASMMYYFQVAYSFNHGFLKKIFLLFSTCLLGLSITINMVASILEGLLMPMGDFVRTPKHITDRPAYGIQANRKDAFDLIFFSYFCLCIYKLLFSEIWFSKFFIFVTFVALATPLLALIRIHILNAHTPKGMP